MSDLNIYLTSLEPNMEQTNCSQSIGGYISTSQLYPKTTLSGNVGLYATELTLNTPSDGWGGWIGVEYISVNGEMINVSPIQNGSVEVVQRGYNNILRMHLSGDDVYAVSSKNIFNDVFNENRKQYRCIAIRNDSEVNNIYDVGVYIYQNSRNDNSSIRAGIEIPKSKYLISYSTSRTSLTLSDQSLIGIYDDNHFVDAYLRPVGESVGGIVQSYDSLTGTFVFYNSFSSITTNVEYEVLPSPSQRLKNGISVPNIGFSVSGVFSVVSGIGTSNVSFEDYLSPMDLFYLWIEREVKKGSESMDSNDFVFSITYNAI